MGGEWVRQQINEAERGKDESTVNVPYIMQILKVILMPDGATQPSLMHSKEKYTNTGSNACS